MIIIDNFLDDFMFNELQLYFMNNNGDTSGAKANWNVGNVLQDPPQKFDGDNTQMYHHLDENELIHFGLKDAIGYFYIMRAKANLTFRNPNAKPWAWHTDFGTDHVKKVPIRTAILYLNTCDGYTAFKSGDKVESVANRYVEFDTTIEHCSVAPTDVPIRGVINFNYVPLDYFPRADKMR